MKATWQTKKLGEVCEISAGNSAPQKKELFINGQHHFIRTSDVGKIRFGYISIAQDRLNNVGIKKLRLFKKGTLLFPKSGASTFLNHRVMMNANGFVSSHLATIKARNNILLDKYFLYYSLMIDARDLMQDQNYPSLRLSDISNISIPLPPLSVQRRIVAKLDKAFAAVAKAKENDEKNLANSKELFESYLNGVFTKPGKGWEEKKLGEVCELKSGTTISKSLEKTNGEVLYVKVGDMNMSGNEEYINSSSRFVGLKDIKINQIIPEGSVIFPKRGGAIFTNKRRKIVKLTIVDLNTMALVPSKNIYPAFLYHWFMRIDLRDLNNGSSIPQINNYSFDNVFIRYPKSLYEQKSIVAKLVSISAQTKKLEAIYTQKLADLEELKKSVLHKAFAGEL